MQRKEVHMGDSVIIVGAGLAGLTAAITLAEHGQKSILVSNMPSERAQSVLAEGGINAALDVKGEDDSPEQHFKDTMRAGKNLEDPEAVRGLTEAAPGIIHKLAALGVPFQTAGFNLDQRSFGGQKKKRTCYVKSSTGKMLMTALIDETRKYEAQGLVERDPTGVFTQLLIGEQSGQRTCAGCLIADRLTGKVQQLYGPVLLACGGMNGLFGNQSTGSVINTGDAAAAVFSQGVAFADLEFIQYHPTTVAAAGKRLLVSEAARGEGGRLYVKRNGHPWYFMEEKYPELGNLMPRDVVSREMYEVVRRGDCDSQVYLDMTDLSDDIWNQKLPDLRQECQEYAGIDPAEDPVPVSPGIHYFMGGIAVDAHHKTSLPGLYAAGECAALYHGANRLGGNSTLGAIYGGKQAANSIINSPKTQPVDAAVDPAVSMEPFRLSDITERKMQAALLTGLGVERDAVTMQKSLEDIRRLEPEADERHRRRLLLAEGILEAALFRKETRGAQIRTDYPEEDSNYQKKTIIQYEDDEISVHLEGEA